MNLSVFWAPRRYSHFNILLLDSEPTSATTNGGLHLTVKRREMLNWRLSASYRICFCFWVRRRRCTDSISRSAVKCGGMVTQYSPSSFPKQNRQALLRSRSLRCLFWFAESFWDISFSDDSLFGLHIVWHPLDYLPAVSSHSQPLYMYFRTQMFVPTLSADVWDANCLPL